MKSKLNLSGALVLSLFLVCSVSMFLLDTRLPLPCELGFYNDLQVAASRDLSLEMVHLLQARRGLTNPEICSMPQDKLERAVFRVLNPKPDHPGEAASFRAQQDQDENGLIPLDGISKALDHIERMPAIQLVPGELPESAPNPQTQTSDGPSPLRIPPTGSSIMFEPSDWTWKGPGNVGGRVRAIVIHPTQPDRMWAGAVSGGIWYSADGGVSWAPVDDFLLNLAVSTLVMDPSDSNILFAGTGEGFYNADAIRGAGVFKSTNGGATWAQLAATATADWYWVNRLAISPDGNILLAATQSGIWRSLNGGVSWTQVFTGEMYDVDFHPTDSNKAVSGGPNGSARYSTDGGITWNWRDASFSGRVELAYAASNPEVVYASVDSNYGEVHVSTDGGQSYTQVNTGTYYLGQQGWYDNIIWVDPTDETRLIVGGIDLWRSTDQGLHLEKISQWQYAPDSVHADHHAIVAHPNFNGSQNATVYFGNDGGVYKADDIYRVRTGTGDNGWTELNNQLGITQFYGAAGNTASGVIVGGTQDNGTLRYNGDTEGWTAMYGGDGGYCASDPTDPNYFYGEYVYLAIHRSTDAGISASDIYSGISDAGGSTTANFIAPFILDPNDANTLLAGGDRLWRSTNIKATTPSWTSIKAAISTGNIYTNEISAIAVAPGDSDIIWVGHDSGHIYRTGNGTSATPAWTRVDENTPLLPDRFALRIVIDPIDHETVYVTFGGFSGDNVYRTSDNGANWTDITGSGGTGLPDVPVRSLAIHPDDPQKLYVGTEIGVFASLDGGANWALPQDGPANVSVDELFWMGCHLAAATHGRGIYEINLCQNVEIDRTSVQDESYVEKSLFQPGETIRWVIAVQNKTGADAVAQLTWDVRDPNGDPALYWQGDLTVPVGLSGWQIVDTVGEVRGTYTFTGTVNYQGNPTQDVTTYAIPAQVLLVDDDDNSPDVRSYYIDSLDAANISYAVWETGGADLEPDADILAFYPAVVWFSGDRFDGNAGPGNTGEASLAYWLENNYGCLMISSQDYLFDQGLTVFMGNYLGVASYENDVGQSVVTGTNTVFGNLGSFTLSYPFSNYSDRISADGSAALAFDGNQGDAAIAKSNGTYKTTYWGFPFEALPSAQDRQAAMADFLDWCGLLPNTVYVPLVIRP